MQKGLIYIVAVGAWALACNPYDDLEVAAAPRDDWRHGTYIPESTQTPGDPDLGYELLGTKGYVGCGIPYQAFGALKFLTPVTVDEPLPGRSGETAWLPYNWNYHVVKDPVTQDDVELAVPNCFGCHAGHFDGKLVIGLGAVETDYTVDYGVVSGMADLMQFTREILLTDGEGRQLHKFVQRTSSLSGFTKMRTVGSNPADAIGTQLFRRRERDTLAWSDTPLIPLPDYPPVPLDVPPWWRMGKKHAQFYNGMGRGEFKRLMMSASSLCVDSVDDAREIDTYFQHVRAYIAALEPPKYPYDIDADKAEYGQRIFSTNCAGCHGSYGEGESYPNLLIPASVVGTDDVYANGHTLATEYIDWYNASFYGEIAELVPSSGYVAPPLDGVWITAPFLHNGSVPSIAALLDSRSRPTYWRRKSYDSRDFDREALGWPVHTLDYGQADAPEDARKFIYDTTLFGHSNRGHTYGDHLSASERAALIEYIKTL